MKFETGDFVIVRKIEKDWMGYVRMMDSCIGKSFRVCYMGDNSISIYKNLYLLEGFGRGLRIWFPTDWLEHDIEYYKSLETLNKLNIDV